MWRTFIEKIIVRKSKTRERTILEKFIHVVRNKTRKKRYENDETRTEDEPRQGGIPEYAHESNYSE